MPVVVVVVVAGVLVDLWSEDGAAGIELGIVAVRGMRVRNLVGDVVVGKLGMNVYDL